MNIFIYGLYNSYHFGIVEAISTTFNVKSATIVGNEKENSINYNVIKNKTFFDWHNLDYLCESFDWLGISALDEESIRSMSSCESVVLKMYDRKSLNVFTSLDYNERKTQYYKHLRFWIDYFNKNTIELFVSINIPHEIIDYIIYSVCKAKGVPTYFFYQFQPDISFLLKDIEFNILNVAPEKYSDQLNENLKLEVDKQMSSYDKKPFYMRDSRKSFLTLKNLKRILRSLIRPIDDFQSGLIRELIHLYTIKKYYSSKMKTVDYNVNYVYFPLHLQPELSTSPLALSYVDQYLIVDLLDYYLPKDIRIYVKEHPNQDLLRRHLSDYHFLTKNSRVSFVDKSEDSEKLLKSSCAVVTCSGTVGWEAIFKNKPVMLFGHSFYKNFKNIYQILTKEAMVQAIDEIFIKKSFMLKKSSIENDLKKLNQCIVCGNPDIDYRVNSSLDVNEDIKNQSSALINQVKKDLGI